MYNPKTEVYNALKALGYACSQGNQAVFNKVPAITFTVSDNTPRYDLDSDVSASDITVTVDVWGDDSVTVSRIASEAEAAMRKINYLLTNSLDAPAPEGCLHHYQLRFSGVK